MDQADRLFDTALARYRVYAATFDPGVNASADQMWAALEAAHDAAEAYAKAAGIELVDALKILDAVTDLYSALEGKPGC